MLQLTIATPAAVNQQIVQLPDFSTYTVVQITAWAKANGIKIPSTITKKADKIQYLVATYNERATGYVNQGKNKVTALDVLQPRIADPALDWLVHLHTHGWCTKKIDGWIPAFTDMFLSWFESCSPNFKKDDYRTWISANMPTMYHGILKHYFGHTELQWLIRELCVPIFARIWGCQPEDLLSSFDGGCFLPAIPKEAEKNASFKQWIHQDLYRGTTGFTSVQGIVNFEDNMQEDGGLVLVEGSQHIHAEYMRTHPAEGLTWGPCDMNDPLLATKPLIKICAPAGHIILFDSRMFHCNVQPHGSVLKPDGSPRFRMCTYVSMAPRVGATEKELAKRIKLYETSRVTGHHVYGAWFKDSPEHPRIWNGENVRPAIIERAQLNPLRSRLIGY